MQDMKDEVNEDIETLKKNQIEILEINNSISQIKTLLKAFPKDGIKLKTEYQNVKTR
jgi:hypothetical protein